MTDTSEKAKGFLAAADHLERWVEALPRWKDDGQEPWYVFLDRRYEAETAIIERLRRAPNCRIKVCPAREHVDLTLGSISVSTPRGLAAACREWARRARERMDGRATEVAQLVKEAR